MREIVLDTETTGLDAARGDRIVEIGAVELLNHLPTGATWHEYINPECPVPAQAVEIHGLDDDFLRDKPVFATLADSFLDFIGDARLIIHNAPFDIGFLNAELDRCRRPAIDGGRAIDTLAIARRRFPGSPNSLDALCRRFGIDNSHRQKHGALLDSEILADVYLELIGGRQPGLGFLATAATPERRAATGPRRARARPAPLAPRITPAEEEAHAALVHELGADAIWNRRR